MIERRYFVITSREQARAVVEAIARLDVSEAHPAEIVIRPVRKEKTHDQRAAWHALLTEFGNAIGYTLREIKEVVKREYYGTDTVTLPNGKKIEIVQSSEDEDRDGYSRLMDFTLRFAAEQGIHLEVRPR